MARQNISIGSAANDGTGDTLRQAAQKINETLVEVYQMLGGDSDVLSLQISLADSAVVFEGSTADDYETRLAAQNPTADRLVQIPNTSGMIVVDTHTQTLTNKALTSPAITTPSITTSINDTNGNESIKLTATSSAVNEITVINAATGNDPVIKASGQSNRNLHLKGNSTTGAVLVERFALDNVDNGSSSTLLLTAAHVYLSGTTPASVSVPNGSVEGQLLTVSNRKGSTVTLAPTTSNIAGVTTNISLEDNESVMLLWDGTSEWFIMGGYGYAVS